MADRSSVGTASGLRAVQTDICILFYALSLAGPTIRLCILQDIVTSQMKPLVTQEMPLLLQRGVSQVELNHVLDCYNYDRGRVYIE